METKPCEYYEFKIEEDMQGTRLDVVLSLAFEDASRSSLQKLIESGAVVINGETQRIKKYKIKRGDTVSVSIPPPKPLNIAAEDIPLDVVYEDRDLLIINKRKGMVVHPAAGNDTGTLVNALLFHCKSLSGINGVIRPGIVHRIDKDTSGLLMIAKNDKAHQSLAEQLAAHSVKRRYHAVVYNNFPEDEGTIREPIGRDPKNRMKQAVTKLNAKEAVTHYKVLGRFGNFTYVEARLETGRTHQIRVHMAYINHPLLGDVVYGPGKLAFGIKGQLLHAKVIGFVHPSTGEYMEFESALPPEFTGVLERLRSMR